METHTSAYARRDIEVCCRSVSRGKIKQLSVKPVLFGVEMKNSSNEKRVVDFSVIFRILFLSLSITLLYSLLIALLPHFQSVMSRRDDSIEHLAVC